MNRRRFLQLAGVGTAVVAAGVAGAGVLVSNAKGSTLSFRAVAGLPHNAPLPVYCSYVIDGNINLSARTGIVTEAMYAGAPSGLKTSDIPWSGFGRTVRVTDVRQTGNRIRISGGVTDHAQLRAGESPAFNLTIDRARGTGAGTFFGVPITLTVG